MMKSMDLTVGDALYLYTICPNLPDSSDFFPYKEVLFLWFCIEAPRHAWRRPAIQQFAGPPIGPTRRLRTGPMGLGARSTLAGRPLLKMVLTLLWHWATVRQGRPLPLSRTWFPIILIRVGFLVKFIVAVTIAVASRLVMAWL
jgi:hypothetical protein